MSVECLVFDQVPRFSWTDTHGVAQCGNCGAPYRLYHYENDVPVDRPAQCLLTDVPLLRRAWSETGARLSARMMGMSFCDRYDVASDDERDRMVEWLNAHESAEARA